MANIPMLSYVSAGLATYPPGAVFGPRHLTDFQFVWILQGQVQYQINGRVYDAFSPCLVLCQPGSCDGFIWDRQEKTRHGFAHFEFEARPDFLPPMETWPIVQPIKEDDIILPLCRYIIAHSEIFQNGIRQKPTLAVSQAIVLLLTTFMTGQFGQAADYGEGLPHAVEHSIQWVQLQLAEDPTCEISLDDMAESVLISREYLCRLYRKHLGFSPMQTTRILRLEMAKQMLIHTNLSIAEVAYRSGFASPDHFSRRFRALYEVTPGVMRKSVLKGNFPPNSPLVRLIRS